MLPNTSYYAVGWVLLCFIYAWKNYYMYNFKLNCVIMLIYGHICSVTIMLKMMLAEST